VADVLPRHAKRFGPAEDGARKAFAHLDKYHGISPTLASERLHEIKERMGYSADKNVIFDRTGNVYDPDNLEWIGSLTDGGAK